LRIECWKRYFDLGRRKKQAAEENCIMWNVIILMRAKNIGQIKEDEGKYMGHAWDRRQMLEIFWWKTTSKIHRLEKLGLETAIYYKWILKK
jgi:hypothetical protein